MENSIGSRIKRAWNAFNSRSPTNNHQDWGYSSFSRPDRIRVRRGIDRSIVTSLYNRIALDVSSNKIQHVRLDSNDRFSEIINDSLNNCLTLNSNKDQTSREFIQDVVMSMMDEGCVAIVPTDTIGDPEETNSYDIESMRTGKIIEWYPKSIKVNVYNENTGKREDIILPKNVVAIIQNPFYSIMNEPNSTLQRLIRKLNLLDFVDEQSSSGKLDLIIQLPYVIKSETRKKQAEERRKEMEVQLSGSKYGVAYMDGSEHITQLNRPVENNLMKQVEYLTSMLYSQLGITQGILDGTADEKTMANYNSRVIEPILASIVDAMRWKFLTRTARSQKQSIMSFSNTFKLVPVSEIAEIADKMTRNEIMSSNELRQIIGLKPSKDPRADELRNKNLNEPANKEEINEDSNPIEEKINEGGKIQNG